MTVAEYLAYFIEKKGIKNVFQLSGGMITQLIDKIDERESINVHSLLHEQSCAFAISAIGRISKKPSVALATSGPGATNLITGIGDCYFDSVPAIFITGQVNTFEIKPNNAIRQLGFQETDILSMVKPITKLAVQIKNPQDIIKQLDLAYSTSISGRHGPVLIDIPMDIQRSQIKLDDWDTLKSEMKSVNQIKNIESVINILTNSKKPIIWAGNGIHSSNSEDLFKEFVKITNIPSVFTLHGIDILNFFDPNRIGFIGSYGNRFANKAVKEADCIIFLGSRIDIRQTGSNMSIFENKKIIRVDCEEGELTNRLDPHIKVNCDVKVFLNEMLVKIKSPDFKLNDWHEELISLKRKYPAENEIGNTEFVNPISFFKCLSKESLKSTIYNVDVGSHQMWAAQSLEFKNGDRFLTSGGMGSMGFALPAAIGASIESKKGVIAIIGDGSFQMNIQELQTIFRLNLDIKIIIINNNSLGMIRQFQETYFESRYIGTKWGYSAPDFCKIAVAYNIDSKKISHDNEVNGALKWLFKEEKSRLLEVMVSSNLNVYPKIAFGRTMDEMEPQFSSNQMEST